MRKHAYIATLPVPLRQPLPHFVFTAVDTLRGIPVSAFVDTDLSRARRRWDRARVNLGSDDRSADSGMVHGKPLKALRAYIPRCMFL